MKRAGLLVLLGTMYLLAGGCDDNARSSTAITVWHFWSEPHQAAALRTLADAFEREHPDVRVHLVPLQWTDGKAKLQLALTSTSPPDVVHLGLDWFSEFARYDVFAPAPHVVAVPWSSTLLHTDTVRAVPWFVNCRAIISREHNGAAVLGLCTSDPHNVLKRVLPLLWRHAETSLCTRLPISTTLDESCILALDALRRDVARGAVLGRSRDLDELFLRGQIDSVVTGLWMLQRIVDANIRATVHPSRSVLNADVLAIPRTSNSLAARSFVQFVTRPQAAVAFCTRVPEAGLPLDDSAATAVMNIAQNPMYRQLLLGFHATMQQSAPLPDAQRMLAMESELEEMIERSLRAQSIAEVRSIVTTSRVRVAALE